jgi:hypothetical protein
MTEKILTLHPEGKAGVNIDRDKYEMIREAILGLIDSREEIAFKNLAPEVGRLIGESFDGSVSWYVTTVKLDLEARGIITRVPKTTPQRIRMSE